MINPACTPGVIGYPGDVEDDPALVPASCGCGWSGTFVSRTAAKRAQKAHRFPESDDAGMHGMDGPELTVAEKVARATFNSGRYNRPAPVRNVLFIQPRR